MQGAGESVHRGRLTEWNDDRGFGFITPLDAGPRVFAHISVFPQDKRRPIAMDLVTYDSAPDEKGRPRALWVQFLTPTPARPVSINPRPIQPSISPKTLLALAIAFLVLLIAVSAAVGYKPPSTMVPSTPQSVASDDAAAVAFQQQATGVQMSGAGVVDRILADDTDGSRHQRFVLRLPSGQTLLVAHNIDIAPRVAGLAVGDTIEFYGEYAYNDEGGVIHWTHHDPDGSHVSGWLKHNGQTYQ